MTAVGHDFWRLLTSTPHLLHWMRSDWQCCHLKQSERYVPNHCHLWYHPADWTDLRNVLPGTYKHTCVKQSHQFTSVHKIPEWFIYLQSMTTMQTHFLVSDTSIKVDFFSMSWKTSLNWKDNTKNKMRRLDSLAKPKQSYLPALYAQSVMICTHSWEHEHCHL